MIQKLRSIQSTCRAILERSPDARDNDRLLMLKVWCEQNRQLRSEIFPFHHWAISFKEGNYADPESIRRCRQKLQEKHPYLRGQSYYHRQDRERETRQGILEL